MKPHSLSLFRPLLVGLLGLVGLLFGPATPAHAQRAAWARSFAGLGQRGGSYHLMATDPAGNLYTTGLLTDTLRADDGTRLLPLSDTVSHESVLFKHTPDGRLLWARRLSATQSVMPVALAVAPTGEVYVTGVYFGALQIEPTTLLTDTSQTFVAKFSAGGAVQWVRSLGRYWYQSGSSVGTLYLTALAVSPTGALLLAGRNVNQPSLDGLPFLSGLEEFVLQANPADGTIQRITHCENVRVSSVTADAAGHVAFGGEVYNGPARVAYTATTPGLSVTQPFANTLGNGAGLFVCRLDAAGTPEWVATARDTALATHPVPSGNDGFHEVLDLTFDGGGNLYLSGRNTNGTLFQGSTEPLPPGGYVAQVRPTGTFGWTLPTGGNWYNYVTALETSADGRHVFALGGYGDQPIQLGTWSLPAPSQLNLGSQLLACLDTAGTVRWAHTSAGTLTAPVGMGGFTLARDGQDHLFTFGISVTADRRPATYLLDGQVIHANGLLLMRFDPAARLSGTVFFDANANGRRDPAEGGFPRPLLVSETRQGRRQTSTANGFYHLLLDSGAYAVTPPTVPPGYRLTRGASGYAGVLSGPQAVVDTLDFGVAALTSRQDLRLFLTPLTAARPGFPVRYRARVENVGTVSVSGGELRVTLDSVAALVGTQPAHAAQTGQTLTWNLPPLPPFGVFEVVVVTNLATNVALGTPLTATGLVLPLIGDQAPDNNRDDAYQIVTGSYDPNDLTVNYTTLTPAQLAAGEPLDYVVRFQNMGSDTAFSVVIRDSLPAALLQLGTLELVGQSHNVVWELDGTGLLTLTFPGIVLPHRAQNVVASMGFVRFRVQPSAALAPGALIPNTAHIVFDFNLPLATNEVSTLVQAPTGLPRDPAQHTLSLYPNPTTGPLTITAPAGTPVDIVDALGRTVVSNWKPAPGNSKLTLPPGLYVVRAGTQSQRLVVR